MSGRFDPPETRNTYPALGRTTSHSADLEAYTQRVATTLSVCGADATFLSLGASHGLPGDSAMLLRHGSRLDPRVARQPFPARPGWRVWRQVRFLRPPRVMVRWKMEANRRSVTCSDVREYGFLFSIPIIANIQHCRYLRERRSESRASLSACAPGRLTFEFRVSQDAALAAIFSVLAVAARRVR